MEGILIIITHPASQLTICLQTVRCQCCQRCGSFRTSWSREWPQLCLRSLCSITRYVYCKYYCHFYCLLFYLRFCVLCFNTVGWETGKASNTRFYGLDAFPVKKTECWCVDGGDLTEICLYYTSSCDHYHCLHHLCGDKILDGLTFWYRIDWCPGIWPLKASLFLSLNDDRKTRRRFYEQRMTWTW